MMYVIIIISSDYLFIERNQNELFISICLFILNINYKCDPQLFYFKLNEVVDIDLGSGIKIKKKMT
jgi:hypothetical protein